MKKIKSFLCKPQLIAVFIFLASGAVTSFLVYGIPCFYKHCKETRKDELIERPNKQLLQKQALQIDPKWRQSQDVSFLEGIWQTDPMATAEGTNGGIILNYRLNANGQGTATLVMADQTECQTTVEARFLEDGRLVIRDLEEAQCGDRTQFRRLAILCQTEGDRTSCEGHYLGQEPFPITLFQQLHQMSSKP